ncbi:MAG TPA: ATP-binding cassette domain-containing protein, partial [Accumulibacter sp.]|nr:ATP-binding cassette domain-containing protein [Accumulibacter sp.]
IDRFKAKATKARQAQSRVKALERMERLAPVLTSADFTFEFKEPNNLPNPMLVLNQARFGYPPPAEAPAGTPPTVIVDGVSRSVLPGQRIGILGANGRGKSTLVKTVAGVLAPLGGTLNAGKGLNVGYFAQQELDVLRPDDSPLSHLLRLARDKPAGGQGDREQDLRGFLGSFNFSGDMVKQPVGTMSGGEKARLVLCMIVWQRPNLLLLDEPTNHLDLATREALAVALNEFEGTVLLVSHDRSLLRAVCDEFWLIGPDGLKDFDGDLDDYQRYLLEEARRRRESLKASSRASRLAEQTPVTPPASGKPPVNRKALQRELDQIERRLSELQNEQHLLEAHLSTTRSPDELAETGRRLQSINEEYAAGEDRWLVLSEQLETADRPT